MENKDKESSSNRTGTGGRLLPSNIQSTLQYFDFEGMSNQEIIDKYEETLLHREQQVKQLSNAIGVLNEKIVHATECNTLLFEEIDKLKKENATKDIVLGKEMKNKELMFEQLNSLSFEHLRMKKVLKTYEQIIQDHHDKGETPKGEEDNSGSQIEQKVSDNVKKETEIEKETEKETKTKTKAETEPECILMSNDKDNQVKPKPKEIQKEINPTKNVDSLFGRVMDRIIGAYETYVTGDEENQEGGDENNNENDNQDDNANANTNINDQQIQKEADTNDKDKVDNFALQIGHEIKEEETDLKPDPQTEANSDANDNQNNKEQQSIQANTINDINLNTDIKKEIDIKESEDNKEVPQRNIDIIKAEKKEEEKPSITQIDNATKEEKDSKMEQIDPNKSKKTEKEPDKSIEATIINPIAQQHNIDSAKAEKKNNIEEIKPKPVLKEIEPKSVLKETLLSTITASNDQEEVKKISSKMTPPKESNQIKEQPALDVPKSSNEIAKEDPEAKQDEKKATKKKKPKKKPKGGSTVQTLGSDSLTYEPFFK